MHSEAPCRFADVAVIGRPKRSTTARGMAASGTRKATLPVLAVERRGSLLLARTMIVRGPGQNLSARRSIIESASRTNVYAWASPEMSNDNGLCFWRVLIW